jgi:ceramide glucosyltransferase
MAWLLAGLVAGSLVYCLLVVLAARRYLAEPPSALIDPLPLSVLKPLAGLEEDLEANLRTFFEQDYSTFELLFAVRTHADPAVLVVNRLQAEYPHIASRLLFVGEPPYPNAKVWSLNQMTQAANQDILVMSDSDIRVTPTFLRDIASEFQNPKLGVASCPYRAVAGPSLWTELEAIGMNTEFLSGVVVARMLEGMKFALGPTVTARRQALEDIGGWDRLKDYLAEDFVLGNLAAAQGWSVILSSRVVEHHIGSQPFGANARHRLRWFRSTRRSRPAGYVGQLFTNPLPLAILLWIVKPDWWQVVLVTALLRAFAALATAQWILRDPMTPRTWLLLPAQDLLSFLFWIAGFFGNTIVWRGRRYHLKKDGTFRLIEA